MKKTLKKRGQKFLRKFSKASIQASEDSKEHIKENFFERLSHIADIRLLILEWGLLIVALILLAVTQAFWFGDSFAQDAWTSGGTYTEAVTGEVNSMNPLFATTNSEKVLSRLMFARIVTIDYSGHPKPEIAKTVKASEDGKVWTITIRDDYKWSDGEPITRDDVLFTLGLVKNPAVNTAYDANLANVKVTEGENGEIVFTLPTSYADFISALTIPVLPKHVLGDSDPKTLIEHSFSNAPICSGPFTFNALQGNTLSSEKTFFLSRNESYAGGRVLLGSFAVRTFADRKDIIDALNNNTVTASAELSGPDLDKVGNKQMLLKNSSLNSGAFIFFNTGSENLKSASVRSAIRQGIDVSELREIARDTEPLDYPILKSQLKLSNYPAIPEFNLDEARAKINELVGEEKPTLEIATVNDGFLPEITDQIAKDLEALGYGVNVSKYEENQEFISNILSKRSYDILVYEVELGADPDPLPYYHSSQASSSGLNLSNYRNAMADDLLLAGRETLDETLRIKKYESFLEYWVSGAPAIGIYQPNLSYYYNKNVRTFSNDLRLVTALDRFADVEDWAVNKTTKNKTP
ncbi:hypothetical protein IKE98_03340 [Candidatus Saccharibacteria bacterium]|nr:hypothetical protein [Candidatus Saccharibacteria bacterium]